MRRAIPTLLFLLVGPLAARAEVSPRAIEALWWDDCVEGGVVRLQMPGFSVRLLEWTRPVRDPVER